MRVVLTSRFKKGTNHFKRRVKRVFEVRIDSVMTCFCEFAFLDRFIVIHNWSETLFMYENIFIDAFIALFQDLTNGIWIRRIVLIEIMNESRPAYEFHERVSDNSVDHI